VGIGHLVALEGLIVNKGNGVLADVDQAGDLAHRMGLGAPVDLRVEEEVVEIQLLELGHGVIVVVAAGHRVQDAAFVEFTKNAHRLGAHRHRLIFKEDTIPQGVVQVPGQALDYRTLFVAHRLALRGHHRPSRLALHQGRHRRD